MGHDPSSIRTAASRVKFLGSAHSGTQDAWHMRLTSIALVPLTIAFVWLLLSLVGKDYLGVRAELGRPFPAILLLLFIVTSIFHMKIGMQSIIIDYVHETRLKDWALTANLFFAYAVGLASVFAVLKLSLV
jgi:succinate dehydrogenase / fumarate reductase membrane anchor subunit